MICPALHKSVTTKLVLISSGMWLKFKQGRQGKDATNTSITTTLGALWEERKKVRSKRTRNASSVMIILNKIPCRVHFRFSLWILCAECKTKKIFILNSTTESEEMRLKYYCKTTSDQLKLDYRSSIGWCRNNQ